MYERFHRYLEVGTWNGYGSTRCFYEGFKERRRRNPEGSVDYHLDSLEVNRDKWAHAKALYADVPEIRVHHARLMETYPSFETILEELRDFGMERNTEGCLSLEALRHYHDVDLVNVNSTTLFETNYRYDEDDPFEFDVVLLDGSELFSYYDFQRIRHTTRVVVLDDCRVTKNQKVYHELRRDDTEWRLVGENLQERNGFAVFERIDQ
jgi:hypothetical protein